MARSGGQYHTVEQIYTSFRSHGLSDREARNFAGVTYYESGRSGYTGSYGSQPTERGGALNPGGAYGIAQWNAGRQAGLQAYAAQRGLPPSDLNAQTGFAVQEARQRGVNIGSVHDIVNNYEVPAVGRRAGEIAGATQIASGIKGDGSAGIGNIGTAGGVNPLLGDNPATADPYDANKATDANNLPAVGGGVLAGMWEAMGVTAVTTAGKSASEATAAAGKAVSSSIEGSTKEALKTGSSWIDAGLASIRDLFVRGFIAVFGLLLLGAAFLLIYKQQGAS